MAKDMSLGDLGGITPPARPAKKKRGVKVDLEATPVPKLVSNADEVNEEIRERMGDLADPPQTMYVKDTPEEIAERNALKAIEMQQAMQNYDNLQAQGAAEQAAATGTDPLASMMSNLPRAETTPDMVVTGPEEPAKPKPRKVTVQAGINADVDVNNGNFKPIDVSKALPHVPTAEEADAAAQKIWDDLDAAVERTKQQISADQEKLFDKMHEEFIEQKEKELEGDMQQSDFSPADVSSKEEEDDDISADAYTSKPTRKGKKKVEAIDDDDLDDFESTLDEMLAEEETEATDEEDEEERKARIEATRKSIINEVSIKIAPVKNKIDPTTFTIAKKPISALKVLKHAQEAKPIRTADWVLPRAKKRITMSCLSGAEIINLNPANSQQNRFNTIKKMYQILYQHVVDANKPSFEAWLKTVYLEDVPGLYFCAFLATFGDSLFMPATCPEDKCGHAFLQDIDDYEDLVVYKDDETKDMIHRVMEGDTTTQSEDEAIASESYQISDDYLITLRRPTIYSTIMETASLPENFLNKYSDMIDVISYIDAMFLIDHKNSQLIPIETKVDPNSASKTAAYKIRTFHDILRRVSSDIYSNLYGYILAKYEDDEMVKFRIPAGECPKCKATIPAQDMSAQQLLFTRHQLAAYGNI